MTLIYAALFILAEEKLDPVYRRMTTTTESLTFNTFTAGEKANAANSHVLVANKEALLVDAQLTKSEANKLVRTLRAIGKPVSVIFITSSHPDRYLGLPVLREAFPDAKVLASPTVAADIKAQWPKALDRARQQFPREQFADIGEAPTPFAAKELNFAGNPIEVISVDGAETAHACALYVASLNVLISGNLASGKTHVWLGEHHEAKWITLLDAVKKNRDVGTVLTGRGDIGDVSLLDENKAYLRAAAQLKTPDRITAKFAHYKAPQLLN